MRTATILFLSVALAACESGDPTMCTNVRCNPPTCCGDACSSNANCCDETVCSTDGRCIPSRCTGCGEVGCIVDYDACTAECAPPASCSNPCSSDADCATGTTCSASVTGELRCYPTSCNGCGGLTPLCQVGSDCSTTCIAPDRCGDECTPGSDCGSGATCHTFDDGISRCVPTGYEAECSACYPLGCSFYPSSCEVRCGTTSERDAGTSAGRDAGGSAGGRDGGTPPIGSDAGGTTAPPPETPSCGACCTPCTSDDQCCPGSSCLEGSDGARKCYPSECQYCSYGCTFHCP